MVDAIEKMETQLKDHRERALAFDDAKLRLATVQLAQDLHPEHHDVDDIMHFARVLYTEVTKRPW